MPSLSALLQPGVRLMQGMGLRARLLWVSLLLGLPNRQVEHVRHLTD